MSSNTSKSSQKSESAEDYTDPAEYIFSNPQYHDAYLTVQDPGNGQTERVAVASAQLAAHSSVLREMFSASRRVRSSNSDILITDVSPAIFKLMLRYMYGGKLPTITLREAAQLAMCADKYNVKPLFNKALKILNPTDVEAVFPALITMASLTCPELEEDVAKIVQEQTEDLVRDPNFLEINTGSLLFIVKQEKLNITEVELWRNVVRWAENQVKQSEKTIREILSDLLIHIRFLTLSLDEIANYVFPTKVLTSDECVNLILAVTGKASLEHSTLCSDSEKRILHRKINEKMSAPVQEPQFTEKLVFDSFENYNSREQGCKTYSNLMIVPTRTLEIEQFFCKTLVSNSGNTGSASYRFVCIVNVLKFKDGNLVAKEEMMVSVNAPFNNYAAINLKKKDGGPLILNANQLYKFCLEFQGPHPIYKVFNRGCSQEIDRTKDVRSLAGMKLQFEDHFHVVSIKYKV